MSFKENLALNSLYFQDPNQKRMLLHDLFPWGLLFPCWSRGASWLISCSEKAIGSCAGAASGGIIQDFCNQKDDKQVLLLFAHISNGVPKGSFLCHLLFFILYVNELLLLSKFVSLLFTDDTTLLLSYDNITTLITLVNATLYIILETINGEEDLELQHCTLHVYYF